MLPQPVVDTPGPAITELLESEAGPAVTQEDPRPLPYFFVRRHRGHFYIIFGLRPVCKTNKLFLGGAKLRRGG